MVKRVSVLVAVYNCAEWLPRCLDSLCAQTHPDVEVICVDDASRDRSLAIIEEYASKYSFIKYLSNEGNCGPAVSRNKAFGISTGDYITMVDSDDWLSPDALERAVEQLDNNDDTASVLFRMVYHEADTGHEYDFPSKFGGDVIDGAEAMRLALDWDIHGLYVARRSLYEKYPFDTSSLLYSDDNTARRHYLHSGKVRFCKGVYYYFQHGNSTLHNPGIRYADWMEATASLKRMLVEESQPDEYINHIETRLWMNIVAVSGYYCRYAHTLTPQQRTSVYDRIKRHHAAVEYHRVPSALKRKFGFVPFRHSFALFMLQARLYFFLRKIVKGI